MRISRRAWVVGTVAALLVVWQLEARRTQRLERAETTRTKRVSGHLVSDGVRWRRRKPIHIKPRAAPGLIGVSGQVLDADTGAPIPGVEVILADGISEAGERSGDDGRYHITVRAGRYRLFVRGDDVLSVAPAQRTRLLSRPTHDAVAASSLGLAPELPVFREITGADLEVVRAAVVRGRVLDRSGRPIAGALVKAHLHDAAGQPVIGTDVAETDAAGQYRLVLAARTQQLEAFHDRFGATPVRPIVRLEAGRTHDVDLTMVAGCILSGRVVGDGIPPGDGGLERAGAVGDVQSYSRAGTFDDDGRFLWSTDEEATVVLRAAPWKALPSEPQSFACRDGVRFDDVVFEIPDADGDLSGTVVTADGAPAALALVDVHGQHPGTTDQQERADAHGNWEAFTLPPGQYVVEARLRGHGIAVVPVTSPAHDVVLQLSGTGSLAGRTTGMVSGAFVLEADCDTGQQKFSTSAETFLVTVDGGEFRVDDLPACKLSLVARRGPWRTSPSEVVITRSAVASVELDLTAVVAKEIHGTVRDYLGRPVAGLPVTVLGAAIAPTTTDPSGGFVVRAPINARIAVAGAPGPLDIPDDDQPTWDVDVTIDAR